MVNKIIILGLLFNSFIIYAQREIFVNGDVSIDGNGTIQSPYNSFKTALNASQNGDIIKFLGNVRETRYTQLNSGEVEPFVINKKITIDGQGFTLLFRASPLSLTQDVVFKNMRLELPPLENLSFAAPKEGHNYIYANGNKVVFDNVITRIEGGHANTRPIIVAGTYKTNIDAGHAEVVLMNSPLGDNGIFKAIIAGNISTPKNTGTKVILDRNAKVNEVILGGVDYPVNAKVQVISESDFVTKFNGSNADDNVLELSNFNKIPIFINIKDLSLKSSSVTSLSSASVRGNLMMDNRSSVAFLSKDDDFLASGNPEIRLNKLQSNGGTIVLPKDRKIIINDVVTGSLNLDINCDRRLCNFVGDEVFMEAKQGSDISINFTTNPHQDRFSLNKTIVNDKAVWGLIEANSIIKDPVNNLGYTFNQDTNTLQLTWEKPNNTKGLVGYQIHKDGEKIYNIKDINTLTYTEVMTARGSYIYDVFAVYSSGVSEERYVEVDIVKISDIPVNNGSVGGRVGINTDTPEVTLDIREISIEKLPEGTPQGVRFPNLSTKDRSSFDKASLEAGIMIYNTDLKCIELYNGAEWRCL